MRRQLSLIAVGIAVFLTVAPAFAHHSFVAEFDPKKPITLKGKLTRFDWVNPHGWIYVDVTGPDGKVVNWAIEAGGPTALLRRGLRKTDFPPGTEVIIKGYLAKNGTPTAAGTTVTLPDGRDFFVNPASPDAPKEATPK